MVDHLGIKIAKYGKEENFKVDTDYSIVSVVIEEDIKIEMDMKSFEELREKLNSLHV